GVNYGGRLGSEVAAFNCRTTYRSLELAIDHESDRPVRTPRHRHHPPGIKNSQSESYAEIGTDVWAQDCSARTRCFRPFAPADRGWPGHHGAGVEADGQAQGFTHAVRRRQQRSADKNFDDQV